MTRFDSNDAFFAALRGLILSFCDRHALTPLGHILNPYLAFNDLTDGRAEIYLALQQLDARCRNELTSDDRELVRDLMRAADAAVHRR